MTYKEAKEALQKPDPLNIKKKKALARTLHPRGTSTFLTVYVENRRYPGQNYYTLAHELGHIVLGHFFQFENTSLFRGGLTKGEYSVLEREAEIFAAELIMPMPVLKKLDIKSYKNIIKVCKVTKSASEIRMKEMSNFTLIPKFLSSAYEQTKIIFHDFIYKKQCSNCKYEFISEDAKYCPICGHNKLIWGDEKMIYNTGYELDENGKAKICPRCGNEHIPKDGWFCHICGAYLINKCTNDNGDISTEPCGKIADGNARYCKYCGAQTTFYNWEFLKNWEEEKAEIEAAQEQLASTSENSFNEDDIPF